ncbi:BnaC01g43330D [Brassica napus]|uniref:BnaC01g43330D protein n=1 Tax=Brassica napus TaxID=3708 RepID=A0A078ID47_BRANA|nr:BnaC01g43330D [Brassica napus]
MIYLITKKLSGGITYQELEGLADPMRKEIALDRKENDSVLMQALLFVGTGHVLICLLRTRLLQRESSFQANTCFGALWVFNENGGFRILDENKKYMRSFQIVVSACAFGGGDNLDQPIGMSKASPQKYGFNARTALGFGMMLHSQRRKQRVIRLARLSYR